MPKKKALPPFAACPYAKMATDSGATGCGRVLAFALTCVVAHAVAIRHPTATVKQSASIFKRIGSNPERDDPDIILCGHAHDVQTPVAVTVVIDTLECQARLRLRRCARPQRRRELALEVTNVLKRGVPN